MVREDNIIVPHWFLEVVENALRIQNDINLDKKTGETCQDRNIRQSLNGIRKLLNGEELTGMERLEKLRPSLPFNPDEAALKAYPKMPRLSEPHGVIPADNETHYLGDANEENRNAFKAGAEWMAEQGYSQEETVEDKCLEVGYGTLPGISPIINLPDSFKPGEKVIVQIRKKQ